MHYDPKFVAPNPKENKIKIDPRFQKMMTDPKFSIAGSRDKYGRKKQGKDGKGNKGENQELKEYYYMDQEEEENKSINDE